MLVLTAKEIKTAEQLAFSQGLSFEAMMKKAGKGCAEKILSAYPDARAFVVLCGKGKNGGDGFVIAKHLYEAGKKVTVVRIFNSPSDPLSEAMAVNLPVSVPVRIFERNAQSVITAVNTCDVIIDAVFGIGFSGRLPVNISKLFDECKSSAAKKVAIDIPSGLCVDSPVSSCAFCADLTLTMLAFKPEHIYKPQSSFCGKTELIPIGFSVSGGTLQAVTAKELSALSAPRPFDANKGTFGNALILAGSRNMPGAAVMAAEGALAMGAGLVTLSFPDCIYPTVTPNVPECVFMPLHTSFDGTASADNCGKLERICSSYSAVAAGCGLGVSDSTEKIIYSLIRKRKGFLLLDADGINIVSRNINILKDAAGEIVLTPHPGEMARLTGMSAADVNASREAIAAQFARFYGVNVLLKGANTVMAFPDGSVFINSTGGPSLARGGSGDLLTGIIVSLSAQGLNTKAAVTAGAYIHGLAGDIAAERFTQPGATIKHTTECIPIALSQIFEGM